MRGDADPPAATGQAGKRPLRPWQFSLRTLMLLMAGVGLFLGLILTGLYEPVFQVLALLVLFFQFYLLVVLAAGGGLPTGWSLARGVGACFVPAAYLALGGTRFTPPSESTYVVLVSASWLSLPSLALIVWLVRRAVNEEDRRTLRRVSLVHVVVETLCLAFVFVTAWLQGIEIDWFGYHRSEGLWLLSFLAGSIPLILWLSLFSSWRKLPKRAWPDSIFRWCMIVALGMAVCSCLYGIYLVTNRERLDEYYSSRGALNLGWGHAIRMGLFFWLPQVACAGMFIVGVTCQLFRAKQDRLLIALGCLYFIPFWLALLVEPQLAP
jgi:hypothetical protein